jgi:hypothetical protein
MGQDRRAKQKHVQNSDGWTMVTRLSKQKRGGNREQSCMERPTAVVEGLTVEKLHTEFKDMEERWGKTTCAESVKQMLQERNFDIREATCIGIGSFSIDWHHRFRSLWQLVFFMAVVKIGKS